MKKQFLGKEKNGTIGGRVKERHKSSEVIFKSRQRRQQGEGEVGEGRHTGRESDSRAKPKKKKDTESGCVAFELKYSHTNIALKLCGEIGQHTFIYKLLSGL